MADEYTTIRAKKITRDWINKIATEKSISPADVLESFRTNAKDTIKQILIDIDKDRYYTMRELARVLHGIKLIESPKVEDAVMLAIDNLIRGMEKSLQVAQPTHYDPSTPIERPSMEV